LYAGGVNSTGNSPHSFAQYSIRFATEGVYYLYYRWRADEARTGGDIFTANSAWIANAFGAFSTPADQSPFHASQSNAGTAPSDNVYDWTRETDVNVYTVGPTEVAGPVVFTIGTREAGMFIDRFVFSTEPALTDAQLDALANSGVQAVAPQLKSAVGSSALTTVTVSFTRPLAAATVVPANFTLSGGVTVNVTALDPDDARIVNLTTTPQTTGTVYTLTVNNVTDTSGTPIAPNSTLNFTAWRIVSGWALKEIYFGITGTFVSDLQLAPNFPASPDRVQWVKGFQLNQDPLTDNYGARLTAFFTPQSAGAYEFYMYNDDEADLFLSPNEAEGGLVSLGVAPSPLSTAPFVDPPFGTSSALASGQRYLLRALLKQGGGDVYVNVAARVQGSGTPPDSLPVLGGNQIATWINPDLGGVTFDRQPSNTTATAGARATFSVRVTATEAPVYYQWRVNGAVIPGAIRATYTTPVLTTADSGKSYDVVISVAGRDTTSATATLTVNPGDPSNLQPYIGVNFVGGGTAGGASLSAVDVAGVVQQERWNNLTGFTFTQSPLNDAAGAVTPVTLSCLNGTEVWYSGTVVANSGDGALMQGMFTAGSPIDPVVITLENVPAGPYNLLVYSIGFDFNPNYYQGYSLAGAAAYPTYHGRAETGLNYIASPGFRRMTNVTYGLTNIGNYVQFDNVNPDASGSLAVSVLWEPIDPANPPSNGHSPAINAIQLVKVLPVTVRPTLTTAPGAGTLTISWAATAAGFVLESSPALGTGATWSVVSGTPNPITGAGSVSVPSSGTSQFFRLRKL
jgi:hypothetical protein